MKWLNENLPQGLLPRSEQALVILVAQNQTTSTRDVAGKSTTDKVSK